MNIVQWYCLKRGTLNFMYRICLSTSPCHYKLLIIFNKQYQMYIKHILYILYIHNIIITSSLDIIVLRVFKIFYIDN